MKESKIFSLFVQFFRRHTLEHPLKHHLCHTSPIWCHWVDDEKMGIEELIDKCRRRVRRINFSLAFEFIFFVEV